MTEAKEKLLTIGTLAKVTGVHIKSLRYYDQIGVLPPAFVDPHTGYRYYSPLQVNLVEAIKFCVELDIPLKKFQTFLSGNKHQIHYGELIAYGSELAQAKIADIQEKLAMLEEMQQEISRAELCQATGGPLRFSLPAKSCWMIPYQGKQTAPGFLAAVMQLMLRLKGAGHKLGYEYGLLRFWPPREQQQYLFVDLLEQAQPPHPQILQLPPTAYLCKKTAGEDSFGDQEHFPEQFAAAYQKVIIEVPHSLWAIMIFSTPPLSYVVPCRTLHK